MFRRSLSDWPAKGAVDVPAMRWWWWWWWWWCSLCSRDACLLAAAMGQPDKLRCVLRLVLTWPRPLQPGVGHFRIVSCIARTTGHGQQNHPIRFDLSINNLYFDTMTCKVCYNVNLSFRLDCSLLASIHLKQCITLIHEQSKRKHRKNERETKERVESKQKKKVNLILVLWLQLKFTITFIAYVRVYTRNEYEKRPSKTNTLNKLLPCTYWQEEIMCLQESNILHTDITLLQNNTETLGI